MYKKFCNKCQRSSFSSNEVGKWICPTCGEDLTGSPYYNATTLKPLTTSPKLVQRKYSNKALV